MNSKIWQRTGLVLAILLLGSLLNSGYFFLGMLNLSVGKWLAFNACSLAIMVYLICYVLFRVIKRDDLLAVPLLPLYYYGTMGLFVMPWNAANAFAQVTHVLITLNVLWILFRFLKGCKFESLGRGLFAGMIVFVPVFAYIQSFTQVHMNEFLKILQGI